MMETERRIPVPDPITPSKSETTDTNPMHIPPHEAAIGICLFRTANVEES